MASRSLYDHIASDTGIARYTAHAQRLLRYQRQLEAVLPPSLRPHAHIANLRADKLIIYASNAAVASKLRQYAPRLAGIFASTGVKVSEIDVKVQVGGGDHEARLVRAPRSLPNHAQQEALGNLAVGLPNDSPLKAPLIRLLKAIEEQ